jgi:hypothetical protein
LPPSSGINGIISIPDDGGRVSEMEANCILTQLIDHKDFIAVKSCHKKYREMYSEIQNKPLHLKC